MIIGNHKQQIVYEGEKILYKICGYVGHLATSFLEKCEVLISENPTSPVTPPLPAALKEEWQIVSLTRK